jgi:DNA-binding IclR family transcriptional regulator
MPYEHMPCIRKTQVRKTISKRPVTARQTEFLKAFARLVKRNKGVSPSLEELAAEMDIKKATAQTFVRRLLANGYLVKRAGSYRNLQLSERKA